MSHMRLVAVIATASCGGSTAPVMRDAGICSSNQECAPPTAVCDLGSTRQCVQCTTTQADACARATPACVNNMCEKCTAHTQCPSAVCLPDGTCAAAADVAYVQSGGSGSPPCTRAAPCGTLADGVMSNLPTVKIAAGTIADSKLTTIDGKTVTIVADPGAKLSRSNAGLILEIANDGAHVAISDLEITGGAGIDSGAIVMSSGGAPELSLTRVTVDGNQGAGIFVSAGSLTLSRSTLSENRNAIVASAGTNLTMDQSVLTRNSGVGIFTSAATLTVTRSEISINNGGGIQMNVAGVVRLSNNVLHHNGNEISAPSGALSLRPATGSKVQFNTIVDNKANMGAASAGGIFCDITGFVADGNLIFRNTGGASLTAQTFGNCTYGNSFVMAAAANDNTPQFVHPNTLPFDYHLTATTPTTIRDAAGACTGVDFDGDTRPVGPACDLGADEYHP
jgi:hypothetical protein